MPANRTKYAIFAMALVLVIGFFVFGDKNEPQPELSSQQSADELGQQVRMGVSKGIEWSGSQKPEEPKKVFDEPSEEGLMTAERFKGLENVFKYDLILLQANPSLLKNDTIFKYFMALNSCNAENNSALDAINNEFTYPKYADFYRANATEALDSVSKDVQAKVDDIFMSLGAYDTVRKVFPFKKPVEITEFRLSNLLNRNLSCKGFSTFSVNPIPNPYALKLNKIVLTELPMDEKAAQEYVARNGGQRNFKLRLQMEITAVPDFSKTGLPGESQPIFFEGKIKKIEAETPRGEWIADLPVPDQKAEAISTSSKEPIIVYGGPDCPWTKKYLEAFKANGIPFVFKDLGNRAALNEMTSKLTSSGFSGTLDTPVLDVGGKVSVRPDLETLLKTAGIKL